MLSLPGSTYLPAVSQREGAIEMRPSQMLLNDIAPTFKFSDKSKISCKASRVDVVFWYQRPSGPNQNFAKETSDAAKLWLLGLVEGCQGICSCDFRPSWSVQR